MNLFPSHDIRIVVGHGTLGDFVRITHLPTKTTIERYPAPGAEDDVRRELLVALAARVDAAARDGD